MEPKEITVIFLITLALIAGVIVYFGWTNNTALAKNPCKDVQLQARLSTYNQVILIIGVALFSSTIGFLIVANKYDFVGWSVQKYAFFTLVLTIVLGILSSLILSGMGASTCTGDDAATLKTNSLVLLIISIVIGIGVGIMIYLNTKK